MLPIYFDVFRRNRWGLCDQVQHAARLAAVFSVLGIEASVIRPNRLGEVSSHLFAVMGCGSDRGWRNGYHHVTARQSKALEALSLTHKEELIAGWELSPGIREWFDRKGIGYLDFRISPVRFTEKLFFELRSNLESLPPHFANKLHRADPPQKLPKRAKASKLIFIGQTEADAAIINQFGRYARWSDFKSTIFDIAHNYDEILYRKHPLSDGGDADEFYSLGLECKTAEALSVYDYFGHDCDFCALSSSVLKEAAFFGHVTHRLMSHRPLDAASDNLLYEYVDFDMALNEAAVSGSSISRCFFGSSWSPPTVTQEAPVGQFIERL